MQPKFTLRNLWFLSGKAIALLIVFTVFGQLSFAQQRAASGAAKAAYNRLQDMKQAHISQMRALTTPSVGRVPEGIIPISGENVVPDVANPNSRAFVYNGSGPFQLNKQSLLNTSLTPVGAPVSFVFPGAAAWRTTTNQLYVIDQGAPFALYTVDTATGVRTFIANCTGVPHANFTGMTWDASTNTMYGVSTSITSSQIFTVNLTTGACTPIGSPSTASPGAIMINAAPGGSLFGVDIVNDMLFRWNKTTGVATAIGPVGFNANFGQDAHFDLSNGEYNWTAYNATAGQAQLRVIDTTTGSSTLVGSYGGQVQTIGIYTQLLPPCSGTPNPGATQASPNPVCPSVPVTVFVNPQGPGTTFQWERSTVSGSGPWTTIVGATGGSHSQTITGTTWFRAIVTCTNGGASATSTPVQVNLNPPTACYCNAGATSTAFEKISRVQFKTIDNPSTSTAGYENFTAISTNVVAGETAPITVTISTPFFSDQVIVWIDLNINGSFTDPGERVYISGQGVGPHTGNITIPASASSGSTRMRIRMHDALFGPNPTPCGNSTYGQVEDYTVNISPCIQGVFTSQPQNTTGMCSGSASFSVGATGSVLSYQWEYRVNSSSPWLLLTNGGTAPVVSGATASTVTLSNLPSGWNGYQFRVIMSGPCTAPDFSNVATLTVGPLQALTNISSANICNGQIVQLRLTNVPATVTTTFNSGTISVPIPDNNLAGVSHSMPVTIPSGSQITHVAATFSIPNHTWPGDLVVVLRDPNNNIINLDYYISGTGAGPGAGMSNTTISQSGVNLLSSSSAPYTGTFRADARTTTQAGFGPPSPTGFAGTLTGSWTPLTSWGGGTANWTIAVYDGFGLDVGTLTNWQLHLTYGSPATGTWTSNPATPNTMFTDPAATVPYVSGSQANTIYVRPSQNTTYCVTYATTNPPCTSAPTCIPVNVFTAVSGTTITPSSPRLCVGDDITLTASVNGGPPTLQWQQSVNAGLTWTNISGATGSTLTLNDVTASMNNNRYRVIASATACSSRDTSAERILKVDLLPVVTISSPQLQITPGQSTTITASSDTTVPANNYTWFLNGTQLSATTNSVVANMNSFGNYQVSVRDKNGCVGTSNVLVIGGTNSERLWIFPNPTNDGRFQVRLYYDGVQLERRKILIYTASGQKVAEKWFDLNRSSSPYMEMSFDLRHLPNGSYLVKVNEQYLLAPDDDVKNEVSGWLLIQR